MHITNEVTKTTCLLFLLVNPLLLNGEGFRSSSSQFFTNNIFAFKIVLRAFTYSYTDGQHTFAETCITGIPQGHNNVVGRGIYQTIIDKQRELTWHCYGRSLAQQLGG